MADPWAEFQPVAPASSSDPWAGFAQVEPAPGGFWSAAEAAARSLSSGLPFSDRLVAAEKTFLPGLNNGQSYADNLTAERAARAQLAQSHPVGNAFGQAIGGLPLAALAPSLPASGTLGNIASGIVTGGAVGGLYGASAAPDLTDPVGLLAATSQGATSGAVVGGALPAAGALAQRLVDSVRPTVAPAARAHVDTLNQEGVNLTAGQATGSRPLQWAESVLSDLPFAGGGARAMQDEQARQFTAAALRRAGTDADLATPDVMAQTARRLGQRFEDIAGRNTVQVDQEARSALLNALREYENSALPSNQRPVIANTVGDLLSTPSLAGADYQTIRGAMSRQASSLAGSDPSAAYAMRGVRDALDGAMARGVSPADAAAWGEARQQWGAMKTIENALAGAGEKTAQGYLSPAQLRTAVARGNKPSYVRGEDFSGLGDLARAGVGVMSPLPQSGTSPRANMTALLTGGGGGYLAGGWPGALATIGGPAVAGRVLMSRPVQDFLTNGLRSDLSAAPTTLTALAAALAAQRYDRRR